MSEYVLEMTGVSKSFPGVKALDNVQLRLRPGKVHALMGENGAGKSTLMKCMFGIYKMDQGQILIDGEPVTISDPMEALKKEGYGLAVVSNCQTGYVAAFLASSGASDLFLDYEEWGRTGLSKGENIRLVMDRNGYTKGIYIGDTKKDQEATLQAGLPFIHAAYGFGKAENPDGIINALSDLPEVVRKLLK